MTTLPHCNRISGTCRTIITMFVQRFMTECFYMWRLSVKKFLQDVFCPTKVSCCHDPAIGECQRRAQYAVRPPDRSGERRVGEESRSRWAPGHFKKKKS